MPKYLVRQNCEYTQVVEATSEEEALTKAGLISVDDWDKAWSDMEVDDEQTQELSGGGQ